MLLAMLQAAEPSFVDAAVKEEVEGKRAGREKKRQAALAKRDFSLGAFGDAEEEEVCPNCIKYFLKRLTG